MLGIIGAMDSEVQELKNEMPDAKITSVAGMDFYEGHIHDKDVVVVKCGIGKVNAAICTQILADRYKVDSVINTGVAGSLNSDIDICDIVISKDAIEHDMDVTALGYERGVIPDMDNSVFHSDSRLIDVAVKSIEEANLSVKVFTGRVVSGDQFISDKEKKKWLTDTFAGYCTEMEGAAIAQVCYFNHIPFLIVRAISDKADDSASMDYPTFEAQAIRHSVNLMAEMIRCF